MLYKLLNKVFGWQYVYWRNSADNGIARVHTDAKGREYYWRYKSTKVLDYISDIETKGGEYKLVRLTK